MLKKDSLTKNFVFQFLYQVVAMVIPLVLSPYLTRTLQETSLGIYSYVNSIAYYFVVFANLGISRHGQRIIAQNRDNEIRLRKSFWSLFAIHTIISVLTTFVYIVFILVFVKQDRVVYYIEILYVLSALFDITWLFYGLENFKSVVIKNLVIKIVQCCMIFVLVHDVSDLGIYTFICAGSILAGQVVMIPQAIKLVKPIKFELTDLKVHLKPLIVFAIAIIASTLYTTFDMTLLGLMSTKENVAFYNYANQIISVPRTVVGVIGTVMFPRACKLAAEGDIYGQKKYIGYSTIFTAIIGFCSIFALLAISNLFAVLYYGEAFAICGPIMMVLSPLVYIVGLGDIVRTQYMIPNGMDKEYIICIVLNAIVNLILTIILIPVLGIYGAVIGTISAECFGLIYQLVLCRKSIAIKDMINLSIPYIVIGFFMYLAMKASSILLPYNVIGFISEVLIGMIVFGSLLLLYLYRFKKEFVKLVLWEIRNRFKR